MWRHDLSTKKSSDGLLEISQRAGVRSHAAESYTLNISGEGGVLIFNYSFKIMENCACWNMACISLLLKEVSLQ